MKHIFKFKLAWLALAASLAFGVMVAPGCGDKPTVADPTKPTVRIIPNSEFCKSIAGLPESGAVGVKGKYWQNGQTIRIGFIGGNATQRKYVTDAVAEIANWVNLVFTYPTAGPYDIRYSFVSGAGSYSYMGTDCKTIPQNVATTNIGWSGISVVLHETLHALNAAHEQSSPNSDIIWNKEVVYAALGGPPNNWSRATVDWNVFRKLTPAEADATIFDPISVMQYSVPGSWTQNYPNGIPGGSALSPTDKVFWGGKYPKSPPPPPPPPNGIWLTAQGVDSLLLIFSERRAAASTAFGKATSDETLAKKILKR